MTIRTVLVSDQVMHLMGASEPLLVDGVGLVSPLPSDWLWLQRCTIGESHASFVQNEPGEEFCLASAA